MQLIPSNLQFLFQAANFRYQDGYRRRKTYQQEFAEQMTSGTETEFYPWLGELTGLREWIGARLTDSVSARSYALLNLPYEKTIGVDRDKIEDDQFNVFGRRIELLGEAAKRWPDDIVTAALVAGTTALCYDGQAFFSSAHPVDIDDASKGTFSNKLDTATGVPCPLNDNVYLTSFATAYATMQKFKGESGISLEVQPTIIMVPPALMKWGMLIEKGNLTAQIIKNVALAENVAGAAVDNIYNGLVKCIVNPRLTDDNAWYLFSTDRIKPLLFQLRRAPELIQLIDPQSPNVFNQKTFVYGVDARGAAGYTLPFLAIRCST